MERNTNLGQTRQNWRKSDDPEDAHHNCATREALFDALWDYRHASKQTKAADARNRHHKENCVYRKGLYCVADGGKPCFQQCTDKGVTIDHVEGVLVKP